MRKNPGKVGRTKALAALDDMLNEPAMLTTLVEQLRLKMLKDPVAFFERVVIPLLPNQSRLVVSTEGPIEWQPLSATVLTQLNLLSTQPGPFASVLSALADASAKLALQPPKSSTLDHPTPLEITDGLPQPTSSPIEESKPSKPSPQVSSPSPDKTP